MTEVILSLLLIFFLILIYGVLGRIANALDLLVNAAIIIADTNVQAVGGKLVDLPTQDLQRAYLSSLAGTTPGSNAGVAPSDRERRD